MGCRRLGAAAQGLAYRCHGGLLVLERDVDLLGETAQGVHAGRADAGHEVEVLVGGTEGHEDLLALLRRHEGLALEHHDPGTLAVQTPHEGGHVDGDANRAHAVDPLAEVLPVLHDVVVVRQDGLVLGDPARDGLVGVAVLGEVAREVHAPAVVLDPRLHRLVDQAGEAAVEVHPVRRVRIGHEPEQVVVDLRPGLGERALEHLAGRLGRVVARILALGLDHEPGEVPEGGEPVLPRVLVDDRDELVVVLPEARDEASGHLRVAVVHREVDQGHRPALPGRHGELVHREGLGEHHLGLLSDEPQERGRREDPVHRPDRDDQVGVGDRGEGGVGQLAHYLPPRKSSHLPRRVPFFHPRFSETSHTRRAGAWRWRMLKFGDLSFTSIIPFHFGIVITDSHARDRQKC